MKAVLSLAVLVALVAACTAAGVPAKKRYDGYILYRVYPSDRAQAEFVVEQSGDHELDFWYEGPDRFDIFVPPHKLAGFENQLTIHGVRFEQFNKNIQAEIDQDELAIKNRKVKAGQAVDFGNWNTYEDIMEELDNMVARCPNAVECETFVVGNSIEGRAIKGLHIFNPAQPNRKAIWLDATIHAREWLSTSTHLLIMKHLIDDSNDAQVADLLSKYDFWLIPVSNPDGYSWTWASDRMWRKNRRINAGSTCIGVDLNRNYNQMWGNAGASTAPCQETFRGPAAASEPETQAVQGKLVELGPTLLMSIHFHTYGQLWLIPWGSTNPDSSCSYAADDAQMMAVANPSANAVQATYGTTWARGNSCATIYPASGITMDYSKGVAGVKYTVTPELRGNAFTVPITQIDPSYNEVWNGVLTMIRTIESLPPQ